MTTPTMTMGQRALERRFYLGATLVMPLTAWVGFGRSFFLRPLFPTWPSPAEPIFYVHGAVFTGWCLLLVGQASLVTAGRVDWHRKLGWAGVVATLWGGALLFASHPLRLRAPRHRRGWLSPARSPVVPGSDRPAGGYR